jgi:glycosyltransferase involved in cell wall biosynthesis
MPELTYVVPVHNGAKFIERAVCSIMSQPAGPPKIIVVDDGSTDETVSVLSKYAEYITLLRQPNRGPSAARNNGLAAVDTPLVCFVDADDYVVGPHRQAVEESYRNDVDIIIGLHANGDDNSIRLSRINKYDVGSRGLTLLNQFIDGNYVQTSTLCWSKGFLKKVGGWDESLIATEDIELAVRAFSRDPKIVISNAPGWVVWHHHDSSGRLARLNPRSAASIVRTDAKYLDIVESERFDEDTISNVLRRCMRDGRSLYLNGYVDEARQLFSMARQRGYTVHQGPSMESALAAGFGTENVLAARTALGRLKRSVRARLLSKTLVR